jgi:Bacterial regulatory helix-turn-helix protein, lysR family
MEWSEHIGRHIRLRELHILLAVMQCKRLAKAAEQVSICRSVVARVVADLEHALGVSGSLSGIPNPCWRGSANRPRIEATWT